MKRILWLATADARGHLMRCQLLARELRARGIEADVVTTSEEGRAFLAAFGVRADVVSSHYRVEFDARQNMSRLRTEWRVFRYFTSPARFRRDLSWLAERARGADLVVNDSFHPALLVAHLFEALPPTVLVYGKNLRHAFERNFAGRLPRPLASYFSSKMAAFTDGAFARVEHSLSAPFAGAERTPRTFVVPPVVALPRRAPMRGLSRFAAVYLNPHFRDPAIAEAIEHALRMNALAMHAVGEGYRGRPGWRPYDPDLADAIANAGVFISAPGMGALEQARALGAPLAALVTDQPEQVANLDSLRAAKHPFAEVACAGNDLGARLADAVGRLVAPARRAPKSPRSALQTWMNVLQRLVEEASEGKAKRWIAA